MFIEMFYDSVFLRFYTAKIKVPSKLKMIRNTDFNVIAV